MKIIISVIFLIFGSFADNEAIIKEIKHNYSLIKSSLHQMKQKTIELQDMSTEGGEAKVYKDCSGHIRLIASELYGESGKVLEEYYFNNDSLLFVYSETHIYNVPMYVDSSMAKESGGEPFDPKKTKVSKQRFYFSANKMIRWIGPDNKHVSPCPEYADREKEILEFTKKLVELVRNKT